MKGIEILRNAIHHYEERHPIGGERVPRYIMIDRKFMIRTCEEEGVNPLGITECMGYKLQIINKLISPNGARLDFIMPLTKWR